MKILTSNLVRLAVVSLIIAPTWAKAGVARIVVGAETVSHVKAFTGRTHTNVASFIAFPGFTGGVRVAAGDVNGDGAPDLIVGTGPGGAHVKVFSGRDMSLLHSFLPYPGTFTGGVFVAAGDVDGDGSADIITGTDVGFTHVKVFNGKTASELHSFIAYTGFSGGVRVAVGDVNGDGRADIITGAGPGGGPHVKVFDGVKLELLQSFLAYTGSSFTGGVFVASGDIDGDGRGDIITGAGPGATPHVKVFNGSTLAEMRSFFAYSPTFSGGVRVASADMEGDGIDEILTLNGPGAAGQVKVFDGQTGIETASFLGYPADYTDGAFIGAASLIPPRLEIHLGRSQQEVQLQWPAGCACKVEANDGLDPRGWKELDIESSENGPLMGMLVPAVQQVRNFRLKCEEEAVR